MAWLWTEEGLLVNLDHADAIRITTIGEDVPQVVAVSRGAATPLWKFGSREAAAKFMTILGRELKAVGSDDSSLGQELAELRGQRE